jgi:hypothetical protein
MIIPLSKNYVGRINPEDKLIGEIRLKYNDQPSDNELCTCGKNKVYSLCCGKDQKIKHKEICIRFRSPIEAKHHMKFTPKGIFVYVDGVKTNILSSDLITTYERAKAPKVLNKISIPGLTALITPDNLFDYFDNIYAVDTNTDVESGISVCAFASVSHDPASKQSRLNIDHRSGNISVGKCSGETTIEAVFAFNGGNHKPEKLAWHIVLEAIKNSTALIKPHKTALVVDSDLSNLESYNNRESCYFLEFMLPENAFLIYASSDTKNNSLINYAVSACDKTAAQFIKIKRKQIQDSTCGGGNPRKATVNFLYIDDHSKVFYEHLKLKELTKGKNKRNI